MSTDTIKPSVQTEEKKGIGGDYLHEWQSLIEVARIKRLQAEDSGEDPREMVMDATNLTQEHTDSLAKQVRIAQEKTLGTDSTAVNQLYQTLHNALLDPNSAVADMIVDVVKKTDFQQSTPAKFAEKVTSRLTDGVVKYCKEQGVPRKQINKKAIANIVRLGLSLIHI